MQLVWNCMVVAALWSFRKLQSHFELIKVHSKCHYHRPRKQATTEAIAKIRAYGKPECNVQNRRTGGGCGKSKTGIYFWRNKTKHYKKLETNKNCHENICTNFELHIITIIAITTKCPHPTRIHTNGCYTKREKRTKEFRKENLIFALRWVWVCVCACECESCYSIFWSCEKIQMKMGQKQNTSENKRCCVYRCVCDTCLLYLIGQSSLRGRRRSLPKLQLFVQFRNTSNLYSSRKFQLVCAPATIACSSSEECSSNDNENAPDEIQKKILQQKYT